MSAAEVWKPIPGYRHYEASTQGRIRSWLGMGWHRRRKPLEEPVILKPTPNYAGYMVVNLPVRRGQCRQRKVHRLVLEAFVGPPPSPKHHGSHMNADRSDNRLANLAWETQQQNNARRGL